MLEKYGWIQELYVFQKHETQWFPKIVLKTPVDQTEGKEPKKRED